MHKMLIFISQLLLDKLLLHQDKPIPFISITTLTVILNFTMMTLTSVAVSLIPSQSPVGLPVKVVTLIQSSAR